METFIDIEDSCNQVIFNRQISNFGRIKTIWKKKGFIKQTKYGNYTFRYFLYRNRKSKTFKTLQGAKIAQMIYIGSVDILEKM